MNRNTSDKDWQNIVTEDKNCKWGGGKINPKMLLDKSELNIPIDYEETKTPNYYIGEVFGYEARNIIEDFDLSYNVGTCLSYILRAKRKHDTQVECIQKAINHLEFELDKLKR
tara:strand:- start:634 stop:972 length:339 start_codon:yes stop_codon:yes gene_type:complete